MPRKPCPRTVALENRAFLRHLAATGNAREAARRSGASRTRFTKRRATDPIFAVEWEQALALADAALVPSRDGEVARGKRDGGAAATGAAVRPTTVRLSRGRHQLRRPGGTAKLTPAHARRFLLALSATANVRLASAAAGLSHATFYALKRRDPAFEREWRAALEQGYRGVESALLAGFEPGA